MPSQTSWISNLINLIDQGGSLIKGVMPDYEKSDKAKTEISNFIFSMLTSCIKISAMFGQLGIGRP